MRRILASLLALSACATTPVGTDEDAPDKEQLATDLGDGKADSSIDWCARWGWYSDGECDQFCLKPDPECQSMPLGQDPAGSAARYPIVLVHGFMGSRTSPLWSFYKLADTLRADGHLVIEADLPPFDAPEARARILASQIDATIAAHGKVNIIAHSQGGLDSRYLISSLHYGDRVASLTTISSPHNGTAIADAALGLLPGGLDPSVNNALKALHIDIAKVRAAYARQAELLRDGVELVGSGSNVSFTFTKLNALKPEMIAEANQNARRSAEQFARDSGVSVGKMKTASQGYFSVGARDGEDCDDCGSSGGSSPFQKVRVVTTIDYDLG